MRRFCAPLAALALVVLGGIAPRALADGSSGGSTVSPSTVDQVIATAEQYLNYPYAYIGDDPSTGFSCIGFVHYVYAQHGIYVPEDLGAAYGSAPHVDEAALQPGDLVFFQDTVWDGLSHVDLYVGAGKMIGADSMQTGVTWDSLDDAYWQEHYLGATRPISNPTGTPLEPATITVSAGPSLAPPPGPSLHIKPGTAMTPLQPVAVYSGPGQSYLRIDMVLPSSALTVVQTQGQWVNALYDGGSQAGWIDGRALTTSAAGAQSSAAPAASTPAPRAVMAAHRRAGSSLRVGRFGATVYSGPGETYVVLSHLASGRKVSVLRTQQGWDQVSLPDDTVGWVSASSLVSGA
ncbi:MAG TPA: NlpC/P60 family protein [Chloroflexota bacterium]|nr:NlpC/P60 family protein [Chloroflexota bacterium]